MLKLEEGDSNKKAFKSILNAPKKTQKAIRQSFFKIGKDLTDELSRQMLAKDQTGTVYIRRAKGGGIRRHRASASGETPANDIGTMRKARGFLLKGSDQLEFGIQAGKGADYAKWLEGGTKRMDKRPGLGNTVKAIDRNAENEFLRNMEKELTSEG